MPSSERISAVCSPISGGGPRSEARPPQLMWRCAPAWRARDRLAAHRRWAHDAEGGGLLTLHGLAQREDRGKGHRARRQRRRPLGEGARGDGSGDHRALASYAAPRPKSMPSPMSPVVQLGEPGDIAELVPELLLRRRHDERAVVGVPYIE